MLEELRTNIFIIGEIQLVRFFLVCLYKLRKLIKCLDLRSCRYHYEFTGWYPSECTVLKEI